MAKIQILFLSSNPQDTDRLRFDEEARSIDEALRKAEFREFNLETQLAVRSTDLTGYMLRYKPNIVHFSGHGTQSSEIILEDSTGTSHPVSSSALTQLFKVFRNTVKLVVLNACFSEVQAQAIAENIDCVIGMSKAIGDDAAIRFATAFYQALGYGCNVKDAFDLGCIEIDLASLDQKDVPQLITRKDCSPEKIVFIERELQPLTPTIKSDPLMKHEQLNPENKASNQYTQPPEFKPIHSQTRKENLSEEVQTNSDPLTGRWKFPIAGGHLRFKKEGEDYTFTQHGPFSVKLGEGTATLIGNQVQLKGKSLKIPISGSLTLKGDKLEGWYATDYVYLSRSK